MLARAYAGDSGNIAPRAMPAGNPAPGRAFAGMPEAAGNIAPTSMPAGNLAPGGDCGTGHPMYEDLPWLWSALDLPIRRPGWSAALTVRQIFTALRTHGVQPHARRPEEDEAVARELVDAVLRGADWPDEASRHDRRAVDPGAEHGITFGEGAMTGTYQLGVAEGVFPRTDGTEPGDLGRLGSYARIAADISDMGGGTLRRVGACEVFWGAVFPNPTQLHGTRGNQRYTEGIPMWNDGKIVPPPAVILAQIGASSTTGSGYACLGFATQLVVRCLLLGLKVNLTPFNPGGGDGLNWVIAVTGASAGADRDATSPLKDGTLWASVAAGKPGWQSGVLVPSTAGWAGFYWDDADYSFPAADTAGATSDIRAYEKVAVSVWPTGDTEAAVGRHPRVQAAPYRMECARRKSLAIAAFATGIGEWLAQIDGAFVSLGGGGGAHPVTLRVYDVVAAIELGNEFNGFWPTGSSVTSTGETATEIAQGAMEAGRYCALVAGPIRNLLPKVRFRVTELSSWAIKDGVDDFATSCAWLAAVVGAMDTEVAWWRAIQTSSPRAPVRGGEAWKATCAAAGFHWPPESHDHTDTLGLSAADLVHELGYHWYHGKDHDNKGNALQPKAWIYADAERQAQDVATFRATLAAVCDPLGITFDLTLGEIGFPSVDPNATGEVNPGSHDASAGYYANTNTTFQAAMLVRILALHVARGVASCSWFTFCLPMQEANGLYANWGPSAGSSLHDESYVEGDIFTQGLDCWPKPAWFAFGRLKALINGSNAVTLVENRNGLTVIRFELAPGPGWSFAYLFWLDQYAPSTSARVEFEGTTDFDYHSLVPTLDEAAAIATTDSNGYGRKPGLDWEWTGFDAAVLRYTVTGTTLRFRIRQADPATAPAPICIFTSGAYVPLPTIGRPATDPHVPLRLGPTRPTPRDPGPFAPGPPIGSLDPLVPPHVVWIDADDDNQGNGVPDAEDADEAGQESP